MNIKPLLPVFAIFIIVSLICLFAPAQLANLKVNANVLLIGNIILLAATLISFRFYKKSVGNNSPQFFMRMIYSAMFTKMMICLAAAFIYIVTYKKEVSKGGIFACMFLYFLYTFVELAIVMKISKQNKNA
ncbi:MAG: hypothetical protein EOO02_17420 [Chitinophagaceae bacterium]|nr:MAG: hypothetical protein EOO02_17420 [Chitinophagaceae bacterium]